MVIPEDEEHDHVSGDDSENNDKISKTGSAKVVQPPKFSQSRA